MSRNSHDVHFEEALTDTDFGLIVCGVTGRLKGLWIPDGSEQEPVPATIVEICKNYFGVDPTEEDNSNVTILH